jgi:hypothetical protein
MKVSLPLVLGIAALIAACASKPVAETAKTGAPTAEAVASSDPVVCRDVTVSGFHASQRVCHTRKEWGQIDYANFAHSQRAALPGSNASSPSADVGVQPWAPGMPVPSQPLPSR